VKNSCTFAILLTIVSFLANPALAGNFTVNNGQTNTTAQTLGTGQSGTVNAGGTLNVSSSSIAITVTGNSTIFNGGTIEQTGTGRAIRSTTVGTVLTITNTAGGLITAVGSDAFQMKATGTVTINNYGTISTTHADIGPGSTGTGNQAINMNIPNTSPNLGITNTAYANTVYNFAGGTVSSYEADALRPGAGGIIYNSGTILSTNAAGNTSSSDGIDAQTNNSGIVIVNGASQTLVSGVTSANLIEGARHAITGGTDTDAGHAGSGYDLPYTMTITNNTGSTIKGDNGSGVNIDGVDGTEKVSITNAGTITGKGMTGDGDGIDVDGVVYVNNSGVIQSLSASNPTYNTTVNGTLDLSKTTSEGITVGGGTILNSGTIEGSSTTDSRGYVSGNGRGITLAGIDHTTLNGTDTDVPIQKTYNNPYAIDGTQTNSTGGSIIVNSGLIKGDNDAGIAIAGSATTGTSYSVTITNTLGGKIEGNGAVAAIDGSAAVGGSVSPIASSNNETVINYGTIQADGTGKAISLGSGNNSVQIIGGAASVIGDMSGGTLTGSNTAALTIDPTTGHSFSYGGAISNFTSVEIKSGTVNFSGANTYVGTTTIDAATLNLTGTGSIGSTTTLTVASGGVFNLGGGSVTVGSLVNSGSINNGTVNTTGTGTVSGLSGSTGFNKSSAGVTTMVGSNTYTGGTTVSNGKLAVDGSITGNATVSSGGELGGHGSIGGNISGAGLVGPGNSLGILTASSVDPSGGLTFAFELTQVGAPTWSNASASGNDVLHLTGATPFTSALTSGNTVDLYFSGLNLTYQGGFFVDGSTNTLTANLANANFNFFVLDNTNGTVLYNGNKYDQVTGTVGTVQITGADFGTGTVNGWTEQFTVAVPEPSTYVLSCIGALVLIILARRRDSRVG